MFRNAFEPPMLIDRPAAAAILEPPIRVLFVANNGSGCVFVRDSLRFGDCDETEDGVPASAGEDGLAASAGEDGTVVAGVEGKEGNSAVLRLRPTAALPGSLPRLPVRDLASGEMLLFDVMNACVDPDSFNVVARRSGRTSSWRATTPT